jgi:hypothetical protein
MALPSGAFLAAGGDRPFGHPLVEGSDFESPRRGAGPQRQRAGAEKHAAAGQCGLLGK